MAFREFKYPDLLATFQLTAAPSADLFAGVPPLPPPAGLVESLAVSSRLASTINTEKARSEGMIAPVLTAFWWGYRGRIGLYSGNELDGDATAGLNGYCDFLLSRAPQQPFVTPPAVVIFEAKRENINDGLGQCIAGMVGAERFNARHAAVAETLYGCVTTGTAWRFLTMANRRVVIDLVEYQLHDLPHLLGILTHMIGPIPPAAA